MEQLPGRASSHLGGAGLERHGAQPDETDNSERRRRRISWFTGNEFEKEKEMNGFRARSRGHAKEASSSSTHRRHVMVGSHYRDPFLNIAAANLSSRSQSLKTLSEKHETFVTQREELRKEIQEVPTDLGLESENRVRETGLRIIELSTNIKDTISEMAVVATEVRDAERQDSDAARADDAEGVPSHITEHARSEAGQLPPPHTIEKLQKQRVKTTAPQRPRPEVGGVLVGDVWVGDVLVAVCDFAARASDELNLAKGDEVVVIEKDDGSGDGRILGENLSTGRFGLFRKNHARLEVWTPRVSSDDVPTVHPTVQTELLARKMVARADESPEILTRTVPDNSTSSVCGSCGARWDPRTGCLRSCDGMQDGLGGHWSIVKQYPKKYKTNVPAALVSRLALKNLGYRFIREGENVVLPEAIGQEDIDDLLKLSDLYHKSGLDEPVSMTMTPFLPPVGYSRRFYGNDGKKDDEVMVFEEHTLPANLYADSEGGAGFSVEHTDSNSSYFAMFSGESSQQPTDPSSWLDSSSADRAGMRSDPVDATFSGTKEEFDIDREVEECSRSISSITDSIGTTGMNMNRPMSKAHIPVEKSISWTTRIQAEERFNEHRPHENRDISRPEDVQESLGNSSQIEGRRMFWNRDSFPTWVAKWVTDTLWPPSNGCQRVWYFCGCGQHTYIDVKELEPGSVESEWRSISESSAIARRAHSPQSSESSGGQLPASPSPVHLGPTSHRNTASPNSPSQETPHVPRPYLNPASAISPALSGATRRDPMFLLICINGKAYKTLAELRCLDINDSYNDELLIRGILNQYQQARQGFSVRRPSFIRESPMKQFISEWRSKWASDVSPWAPLHIIDTADFVEFELVPHPEGKEAFPSHFTSGRWPAPDNKQYRYRPVPMKCIKTMNLWHMRRPGPHTEVYWYNTVPKKVDGALYRPSGTVGDVVGYGVRINERLNDVLVLWWCFVFILATGVFIYVYSRCTSDDSSAFGMGAYLVAALTVYIQLQYAWWKRT
ncbi:hypothetical protein INS49_007900 [Diaporthe citri]|uniref:uncharacterized protein n=1 Tax=Diaporthe citri TaxID=83186 RepID=UPI001C8256A9|nr:uncharacterized protein INS49_007900 [Diaporthe citri]KAG6362806.1 hypothetical protein INS49_007900 [Diaporthe citri]